VKVDRVLAHQRVEQPDNRWRLVDRMNKGNGPGKRTRQKVRHKNRLDRARPKEETTSSFLR
jgi:hypothetical protein